MEPGLEQVAKLRIGIADEDEINEAVLSENSNEAQWIRI